MIGLDKVFKSCTTMRKTESGYMIQCKFGLWRVDAPTLDIAEREAKRYFFLYFGDGEYKNHLAKRCHGSGSDEEGWREGCEDCLRRTSPRRSWKSVPMRALAP